MEEIPKPQKEIKNLVFNRDCCVIYFPIFIFCFGISYKKLTRKKNHSVNPPKFIFVVVIICVHWFFFLADWPVRRFTRHESFVIGTNGVCVTILRRERGKNKNKTKIAREIELK